GGGGGTLWWGDWKERRDAQQEGGRISGRVDPGPDPGRGPGAGGPHAHRGSAVRAAGDLAVLGAGGDAHARFAGHRRGASWQRHIRGTAVAVPAGGRAAVPGAAERRQ